MPILLTLNWFGLINLYMSLSNNVNRIMWFKLFILLLYIINEQYIIGIRSYLYDSYIHLIKLKNISNIRLKIEIKYAGLLLI